MDYDDESVFCGPRLYECLGMLLTVVMVSSQVQRLAYFSY